MSRRSGFLRTAIRTGGAALLTSACITSTARCPGRTSGGPAVPGGVRAARAEPAPSSPAGRDVVRREALARQRRHRARLDSLHLRGASLVIEVDAKRFDLYGPAGQLLRSGPCSTGSDSTLRAPDGRTWTFRTPRGRRRVAHKARNPVWAKPDWAYVEEGLAVPPAGSAERHVRGMLGPCALDIGNGYLIHGSPYRIGIGTSATHGCVRLLDEDLEEVYRTLRVGDAVFLD